MKYFFRCLRHQLVIYLTCPIHNPLVEYLCPHKGKANCDIWTCPAHFDLRDHYIPGCRYYFNKEN